MNDVAWSDPCYETVIRTLGARTGLAFPPHSRPTTEQRIRRSMAQAGLSNLAGYGKLLETDPQALDQLVVALTVGETYFFREPAQFDFIRNEILPEIQRRCGPGHMIRAWSAGCASGEEAYSLSILFQQAGVAERSRILATDISRAALDKAHQANYREWSLRGEGAARARIYLSHAGDSYQVEERIRRTVNFEYLNLALDVYPSMVTSTWGLDLILCRNVLIYFDRETIRSVAGRLYDSLAPGGWLITSSSDPSLDELAPFEVVVGMTGIFYRRGGGASGFSNLPRSTIVPAPILDEDRSDMPMANVAPVVVALQVPEPRADRGDQPNARHALVAGDYLLAVELTRENAGDPAACAIHIQALANLDMAKAQLACRLATQRHPLSPELHYLQAVLLLEANCDAEAAEAARRVVYLNRTLALGHFTLGSILRRLGDYRGARRAFRNARDLCAARPPDELVPLSDDESAGRLAEAAERQFRSLDSAEGSEP